jgi:uncharacterized protein YjdB
MSLATAQAKQYQDNDKLLLKSGDVFYAAGVEFDSSNITDGNFLYISSYGEGPRPVLSGARIANSSSAWQLDSPGIWKIDMLDEANFSGLKPGAIGTSQVRMSVEEELQNVGFIDDASGQKHFRRAFSMSGLLDQDARQYDYFVGMDAEFVYEVTPGNDSFLYMKSDQNPCTALGELVFAVNFNLLHLDSNTIVDGLHVRHTGALGINAQLQPSIDKITIRNCVIEDIGGSVMLDYIHVPFTRYGNGIEFYQGKPEWSGLPAGSLALHVKDLVVERNIFRDVYDAAFTIQGVGVYAENIFVNNNLFIANGYSVELWGFEDSIGIINYQHRNNVHINQGGWGYEPRPDKFCAAEFVFYGFREPALHSLDIQNNVFFNPLRIYYVSSQGEYTHDLADPTSQYDNNSMYLRQDSILVGKWNIWQYWLSEGSEKDTFLATEDIWVQTKVAVWEAVTEPTWAIAMRNTWIPMGRTVKTPQGETYVAPDQSGGFYLVPEGHSYLTPAGEGYMTDDGYELVPAGQWYTWVAGAYYQPPPYAGDIKGFDEFARMQLEFGIEQNSTATLLTSNDLTRMSDKIDRAMTSYDYELIWSLFSNLDEIAVTGIHTLRSAYVVKGKTLKLPWGVWPYNAADKTVTWESNKPSVATVASVTGKVTAKKTGTAIITATSNDGKHTASCKVYVVAKAKKVKGLSAIKATGLQVGKTKQVLPKLNPVKATGIVPTFKSSNKSVAVIDKAGGITALKPGTTTISVMAGGKTQKFKLTVGKVAAENITLNKTTASLSVRKSLNLKVETWMPADTDPKKITWRSTNINIATVDAKGKVTGKARGNATIIATTYNGKTAKCTVKVR